ncbi:S-adenosylmethionine decarboxylase [Deinococcus yavapaiensis KR-236]|uniref:S-adenosylmethionine decarboxylase n=2 Tax=Deinococcus TaxID=1298 RepID=A0A318S2T1_9DEIO|nr:S-adenosylmethionine decarboxylase [Deinococcus yavapaiensis KR-236]
MELFGFGPHLMIDGYHASSEKLDDVELIRKVLDELPVEMEMTKILPPHVQRYNGTTPEDSGVTGVVIIAESHIAIHTFPQRGFLSVDVFSCKEFDVQKALNYLIEHFEMGRYDTHFINRGKEFPKDLTEAERIVSGEREYLEARIA